MTVEKPKPKQLLSINHNRSRRCKRMQTQPARKCQIWIRNLIFLLQQCVSAEILCDLIWPSLVAEQKHKWSNLSENSTNVNVIHSHNLRGAQNDLFIPKSGKYEDPSEDFSLKGLGYTEQANQLIFVNGHICIKQGNLNFQTESSISRLSKSAYFRCNGKFVLQAFIFGKFWMVIPETTY